MRSGKLILHLVTFSPFSDPAALYSCRPGLSHSALLCGRSLRGHHDCGGSGHHVCSQDRLVHGENSSAGLAETTSPLCKSTAQIPHKYSNTTKDLCCADFAFFFTAIPSDNTMRIPRRKWNVHHRGQSKLLCQGGHDHQEPV